MSKPNIIFIYSDQHRGDAVGCAGHPVIKTPNLDRLGSEGVVLHAVLYEWAYMYACKSNDDDWAVCAGTRCLAKCRASRSQWPEPRSEYKGCGLPYCFGWQDTSVYAHWRNAEPGKDSNIE